MYPSCSLSSLYADKVKMEKMMVNLKMKTLLDLVVERVAGLQLHIVALHSSILPFFPSNCSHNVSKQVGQHITNPIF